MSLSPARRCAPLAALALFLVTGCGAPEPPAAEDVPVAVRTRQPERATLSQRLGYPGSVHSRHEVRVEARAAGTVAELQLSEGDTVTAGEPLVRLAAPEVEAARRRARAEWDYWRDRHAADSRLAEAGALPAEAVDASRRAVHTARAALDEAEARVTHLSEPAPSDGTLLSRLVEPGQNVRPGQPLAVVGSGRREVRVEVVAEDVSGLRVGGAARVATDGEARAATITDIAPSAAPPARTHTVRLALDGGVPSGWRWGAAVRVELILARCDDCVSVPVEALVERDGGTALFVVREDVAHLRRVQPGIVEGGRAQVDLVWDGIDAVAVSNLDGLRDGARVYPVPVEAGLR